MITLVRDTPTTVVVTFTENTTISEPYYLIEVTDSHGDLEEYITPTELSTSLERYNEFLITSSIPDGEYLYKAYQSDTENPTIEDVIGDPIEYGIVVVTSDAEVEDSVYL